jgi:penicillin-binding protein 2
MRNIPQPLFADDAPESEWSVDAVPRFRMGVVFALFAVVFLAIVGRLIWLQIVGVDRYLSVWDRPVELLEPIAARDGRILSADGQVLAYDAPRFDLLVHYRWLEEPVNDAWLTASARASLSRSERRNKQRLSAAKKAVLNQREELWRSLAAVTGNSSLDLVQERAAIQKRIERMRADVERRRAESELAQRAPTASSPAGLAGIWDCVVRELTTPPERPRRDPLVIREELDFHPIAEGISLEVVAALESFSSRFPGVRVHSTTERIYPQGDLAAHLIGTRQTIRPEMLTERAGRFPAGDPLDYQEGDRIGLAGLEQQYESLLRGQRGQRRVLKNRQNEILSEVVVRPPRDGQDVTLTLEFAVQKRAEQLLDAALGARPDSEQAEAVEGDETPKASSPPVGGCIVAIDVRTGAVLAAAAAPRFDLQMSIHPDAETWKRLAKDPGRPFFPRATQMELPPGSVFKLVTAIAGLQEGAIQPDDPFLCRGYLNRPDKERCSIFRTTGRGHGEVGLDGAICESCNVYFLDAAQRIGPDPLIDWATRFGFGQTTGIDLSGERRGRVPSPDRPGEGQRWYPGTTRQMAIGQASLTATPLQVVRMIAAIANGGRLVPVHLFQESGGSEVPTGSSPIELVGHEEPASRAAQPIEGLTPGTLERIRSAMEGVVSSPNGTGRFAGLEEVSIAGKTGTAETGNGRPDHAWFAGYAPADRPRVAFVVVLEHGGSGGRTAGPIAREFVRGLLQAGLIERTDR